MTKEIKKEFDRGVGRDSDSWEKLYAFMDQHGFTCADFLACVCAHLCHYSDKEFDTEIMCGGYEWKIKISRKGGINA